MTVREKWQMICPQCGSDEFLEVSVRKWVRLTEEGSDFSSQNNDEEWDETSPCYCAECGWTGVVETAQDAASENAPQVRCGTCDKPLNPTDAWKVVSYGSGHTDYYCSAACVPGDDQE